MAENYFRITSLEDSNVVQLTKTGSPPAVSLQYRTDLNDTWQTYTIGTQLTLFNGSWIELRNSSRTFSVSTSAYYKLVSSKKINVSGHIGALLDYQNLNGAVPSYAFVLFLYQSLAVDASALEFPQNCGPYCYYGLFHTSQQLQKAPALLPAQTAQPFSYANMFMRCYSLVSPPVISATTLAANACNEMFRQCTSLQTPPDLPATDLGGVNTYLNMFNGCTALTSSPALPATNGKGAAYQYMFNGCTRLTQVGEISLVDLPGQCCGGMFMNCSSIVEVPDLHFSTIGNNSCKQMFSGCTSLKKAPAIPATSLGMNAFMQMFYGCSNLEQAPVLSASTLNSSCYEQMFYNCTKLNSIEYGTSVFDSNLTTSWLYGCSSTGTFYYTDRSLDVASIRRDESGIPAGWTIEYSGRPSFILSINGKPVSSLTIDGRSVQTLTQI